MCAHNSSIDANPASASAALEPGDRMSLDAAVGATGGCRDFPSPNNMSRARASALARDSPHMSWPSRTRSANSSAIGTEALRVLAPNVLLSS